MLFSMISTGYMENPEMTGKSPIGPVPDDVSLSPAVKPPAIGIDRFVTFSGSYGDLVITGTDFGDKPQVSILPPARGFTIEKTKKLFDGTLAIQLKYNPSPVSPGQVLSDPVGPLGRIQISITVTNPQGKTSPPAQFDCMVFTWA